MDKVRDGRVDIEQQKEPGHCLWRPGRRLTPKLALDIGAIVTDDSQSSLGSQSSQEGATGSLFQKVQWGEWADSAVGRSICSQDPCESLCKAAHVSNLVPGHQADFENLLAR